MKQPKCSSGILLGFLAFFSATLAMAEDWPQWRGANRDARVTGFTAPATWPKELTKQWSAKVGSGDATPALVGDRLYAFGRQDVNEVTTCLSATDGKVIWQESHAAGATVSGPAAQHPGPRSSPAVADGKVVNLGVGGIVTCLDAASGKVVWQNDQYKTYPNFYTATSPIIVDGLAIVHLGGRGSGSVVAFQVNSGEPKWKLDGDAPGYASPVLMTVEGVKQIVNQTEKNVVGIGVADGKLLWSAPLQAGRMTYNAQTPIIDGALVIYSGQGQGTIAIKIEKQGDTFTAKEVWKNPEVGTQFNTPVLKDGALYGLSDRGQVFCLDAKTGKTNWQAPMAGGMGGPPGGRGGRGPGGGGAPGAGAPGGGAPAAQPGGGAPGGGGGAPGGRRGGGMGGGMGARPGFGSVVDAGSVLIALSPTADMVVFKPSDKEYTEVAKIKVADSPSTYAYPILSGNRIFIKDAENVICYGVQ
jgi:outer membrane protein assembly factor BamB